MRKIITLEEAKNVLIEIVDSMQDGYMTHLEHGGKQDEVMEVDIEAISMGIKAFERLIPRRPTYEGDGYCDGGLVYDTWICPNCEVRYEVDYDEYDHCPNCGQAIDWSDDDESM